MTVDQVPQQGFCRAQYPVELRTFRMPPDVTEMSYDRKCAAIGMAEQPLCQWRQEGLWSEFVFPELDLRRILPEMWGPCTVAPLVKYNHAMRPSLARQVGGGKVMVFAKRGAAGFWTGPILANNSPLILLLGRVSAS